MLLGSNDGARPADADPSNAFSCTKTIVFHQVAANQCAGPAQTGWETNKMSKAEQCDTQLQSKKYSKQSQEGDTA